MSYSRLDKAAVDSLANELRRLGQEVWLDEELTGGVQWWASILKEIRNCDCFIFAESKQACESAACMKELDYAHRLGKPILPILVGAPVPNSLLPPHLAETQRIDARKMDQAVYSVARALLSLPPPSPLPEPLPESPSVPVSYMTNLREKVAAESLSLNDQGTVLVELKGQLAVGEHQEAAAELLRRLRTRNDVYAAVAVEIDEVLRKRKKPISGRDDRGRQPPTRPPRSDDTKARRDRPRRWIRVPLLLIALAALSFLILLWTACTDEDTVCDGGNTVAAAVIPVVVFVAASVGYVMTRRR